LGNHRADRFKAFAPLFQISRSIEIAKGNIGVRSIEASA
jgi:hypothetical protein